MAGRIAKRSGPLFKQLLPAVEIELTDPLRFILGAIMIMRYERFDPVAVMRLASAIWVAVLAGVLPILGAFLTGVDPVVYAVTVFVMG